MRFNDGAANGQAQSHPSALGREKAIKEMIEILRLDAGAAVFESATQGARIGECGANNQGPAHSFRLRHRLDRVDRRDEQRTTDGMIGPRDRTKVVSEIRSAKCSSILW
jgi:hypothetical protein